MPSIDDPLAIQLQQIRCMGMMEAWWTEPPKTW